MSLPCCSALLALAALPTAWPTPPLVVQDELPSDIEGVLVDEYGNPVSGAQVRVRTGHGSCSPSRHETSASNARSGTDGSFSVSAEPLVSSSGSATLEVSTPEYVDVSIPVRLWSSGRIDAPGTVRLTRSTRVRGRVVDETGRPMPGAWSIVARSSWKDPNDSTADWREYRFDPERRARFEYEDVPPGTLTIRAEHELGFSVEESIEVLPAQEGDEPIEHDLVYRGEDPSTYLGIQLTSEVYGTLDQAAGPTRVDRLQLTGPEGDVELHNTADRWLPSGIPDVAHETPFPFIGSREDFWGDVARHRIWYARDLPFARYALRLEGPEVEPQQLYHLLPGELHEVQVVGTAAVIPEVVDEVTGVSVTELGIGVRLGLDAASPFARDRWLREQAPWNGEEVMEGLLPVPQVMEFHVPGYAVREVALDDLRPRERRRIRVEMDRGSEVVGTVLQSGALAERVEVGLHPAPGTGMVVMIEPAILSTETDEGGRYSFSGIHSGEYLVIARKGSELRAQSSVFEIEDESAELPPLELPVELHATGTLLLPDDVDAEGVRLELRRIPGSIAEPAVMDALMHEFPTVELDSTQDTYWVEGLGPYGYSIWVAPPGAGADPGLDGGLVVASLDLTAGRPLQQDIDLRDVFPGSLAATLEADGASPQELRVRLHGEDRKIFTLVPGVTGRVEALRFKTGTYTVSVERWTGDGRDWCVPVDLEIDVTPAETAELDVVLQLSTQRIRVLDEHGTPFSDQTLWLVLDPEVDPDRKARMRQEIRTDADGCFERTLPPSSYLVFGPDKRPSYRPSGKTRERAARVDWPQSDGSLDLRLPCSLERTDD